MAIPTRAKNILLLPLTDGGVTQPFNMPGFSGYDKNKAKHNGLDIGWTTGHAYWPIIACQDGKVVDVYNNNSSIGHAIVVQHDYEDGTHRWTGYIHLKDAPTLKKGATVKQGDKLGIRGGSPYVNGKAKYGVHLHLYVSKAIKTAYTWNTMKSNVVDPLPLLFRSKKQKYDTLVGDLAKLPYLEDALPEVVKPVERDETVNQLLEKSSILRVRMEPSTKGTFIGYLQANAYYNYYDVTNADNYDWYKIAENQWCAKTSTMVLYPAKTELELAQEAAQQLELIVNELNESNKFLVNENLRLSEEVKKLSEDNKALNEANATLTGENLVLTDKLFKIVELARIEK